jgi:broad specificity phosphatase PhoE
VVVACHGGVINAYLAWVLGLAEDMFFRPAHASVQTVLVRDDRRVIQGLNDVSHLRRRAMVTY